MMWCCDKFMTAQLGRNIEESVVIGYSKVFWQSEAPRRSQNLTPHAAIFPDLYMPMRRWLRGSLSKVTIVEDSQVAHDSLTLD